MTDISPGTPCSNRSALQRVPSIGTKATADVHEGAQPSCSKSDAAYMAHDGHIAGDTLFGPERPATRAIDRDQSDRGRSSACSDPAANQTSYTWPQPKSRQHHPKNPCPAGAIHTGFEAHAEGRASPAPPRHPAPGSGPAEAPRSAPSGARPAPRHPQASATASMHSRNTICCPGWVKRTGTGGHRQAPVRTVVPGQTGPCRGPGNPAGLGGPCPSRASLSPAPRQDRAPPPAPRPAPGAPSSPPPDAASPTSPRRVGRSSPGRPPSAGSQTVPPRSDHAPSRQVGDAARHRKARLHGRNAVAPRRPPAADLPTSLPT